MLGFWNFDYIFILSLPSLPHTPLHTPSYLLLASHATSVQLSSRFPRVSTLGSVLSPDPKLFDCSAYMAWEVSLVVWEVLVPLCHPVTDSKCINLCSFNLQETTQCLHKVPSIFSTFILLHEERGTYGDQLYKLRTRCLLINSVLTMQKHFNLN